jgi:predicted phage terminase large subunit-like protein
MQRLHEPDISGVIISLGMDYVHLMLPMEFDPRAHARRPSASRIRARWMANCSIPERFPRGTVEALAARHGQLRLQRPVPAIADAALGRHVPAWRLRDRRCGASRWPAGRAWDFAASQQKQGKQPDWTVGLRMLMVKDTFYVEDVLRGRWSASEVETNLKNTASQDGHAVTVRMPQDPGAAGKADAETKVKLLKGYSVVVKPISGDKATRARPASAQAEAGNVKLLRGPWNEAFLNEVCAFPNGTHSTIRWTRSPMR